MYLPPDPYVVVAPHISFQYWDPALLQINSVYALESPRIMYTPQATTSDYKARLERIIGDRRYIFTVKRKPEFLGEPSFPSIVFSINGIVGPHIEEVLDPEFNMDRANDLPFAEHSDATTEWRVDWPGLSPRQGKMATRDKSAKTITRAELARTLAVATCEIIENPSNFNLVRYGSGKAPLRDDLSSPIQREPYDPLNELVYGVSHVNPHRIRLLAASYYQHVWIPIFALRV